MQRDLGDGQRWRESYELRETLEQPGGRALTRPEFIRPGWLLLLPRDAMGLPEAEPAAKPVAGWVPETLNDTDPEPLLPTPILSTDGAVAVPSVAASAATPIRPTDMEVVLSRGSVELAYPKDAFPIEEVYGDTDHAALRLITCGGNFDKKTKSYRDNIVVFARLVA